MALLTRDFYGRDPVEVARELIGMSLIRRTSQGLCGGAIVETEAYLASEDSASHSYRGMTRKNATMFGRAGLLYVYPIHGRYCLNAVTESRGIASAVLIRAVRPLQGVELMQKRRHCPPSDLARGPARLCEAFDVDRRLDGWDLTRGTRIWIEQSDDGVVSDQQIVMSPRIGVTSGHGLELRFFLKDNPYVSGPRRRHASRSSSRNS
ncbi:MAG: DNA-3-methyladenine glycosylase [Planctomycetaceae bacterium]|nr:DNA-3-methyladenine glycosylase [Planctomycetaceae bacterium]